MMQFSILHEAMVAKMVPPIIREFSSLQYGPLHSFIHFFYPTEEKENWHRN